MKIVDCPEDRSKRPWVIEIVQYFSVAPSLYGTTSKWEVFARFHTELEQLLWTAPEECDPVSPDRIRFRYDGGPDEVSKEL